MIYHPPFPEAKITRGLLSLALAAATCFIAACSTRQEHGHADAPELIPALQAWSKSGRPERFTVATPQGPLPARIRDGVRGAWDPHEFDELLAAESPKRKRFDVRATREGIGTPLVGLRNNPQSTALDKLYPPEGIIRPVTATAETRDGSLEIVLQDPARTAAVAGQPLAADFSAPWEELVLRASKFGKTGIIAMLNSRGAGRKEGLFLMQPYDQAKTPLIMVHGLLSTPLMWASLTNELLADEVIRKRYQIWHYFYPTGRPFLYSAMLFRRDLAAVRALLDPTGHDPAIQRTVILAHSMGGLISKTLVQNPDDLLWEKVFQTKDLVLNPEDARTLHDIFHFKAQSHVDRIIFVATPHRGSNVARNFIGRTGDLLIRPDRDFKGLYARVARGNPNALTPAFADHLSRGQLTSIDTLSPSHPILQILADLPMHAHVHSIIGDRGREGLLEDSSDGVVPYLSSHLKRSLSERVVPAAHGAFSHPDAVQEIKRILKL